MAVSHVYPVIDFTLLDYDKIPIGTFLIGFDSSNGGKLCKMDHNGTITIIESGLLPSLTGLNYIGLWNADTNNPVLTSSVGTAGDFYIVSVLGTTNLNGITDWQVGDWAIFEGGVWTKVDNHDIQTYNTIKDEGTILPQRSTIKFTGTGVTASDVAGETVVNIPIQTAYKTAQDEGSSLTQRDTINFIGGGVTVTDTGVKTQVSIPTQQAYTTIQEEGSSLTQQSVIDFQGAGITASDGVGKTIITVPIQPAYSTVKDEGSSVTQRSTINFVGGGVTASDVSGETQVSIPTQQAYTTIQEEGSSLTQTNILDFQGTGVTATNGSGKTIVTIPGSLPTTNFGLHAQTSTSTPVTNTISELSLLDGGVGTLTVPANGFSVGDSFHAVGTGHISSNNNNKLRIRVKTGAIILADTGDITMPATTTKHWKLDIEFTVRTIGGSGVASIVAGGSFLYSKNASNAFEGVTFSTETVTGFNTTISNTLTVTAQWDTASTGNSIYSEIFTLTKVY
ncbi:hypothetical protein UFOVP972_290 [uncultured Caudovirales phage]|uniref:Uncharacterized protein n=1 Tax=uncultured Caudovirales phage TaxID=2100421 RepID=A0A6J5PYF3_9CAUD|nr:hypothetical protein UFOVP972_290 [uncultured Caudovirales phage]